MTNIAKYAPTTAQARPVQRYQRPGILTPEQTFMVILVTFVACYLVDWYGLLVGVSMTILLAASNACLRMTITDIENEESEEGSR